jgi:hypothetical protein
MAESFWCSLCASHLAVKCLDQTDLDTERHIPVMLRYQASAERSFLKFLNELRKLQKERRLEEAAQPEPQPLEDLQNKPNPEPEEPAPAPVPAAPPARPTPNLVIVGPANLNFDVEEVRKSVEACLEREKKLA